MSNPIEPKSDHHQHHQRSPTVKDFLRVAEMEDNSVFDDRHGDSATIHCMTPRQIVSKWVKKLRHKKDKLPSLNSTPDAPETLSSNSGVSRRKEETESFKLGAGIGLALVVAASKKELDKMMELRKQMEMIVEDAKKELLRKSTTPCNSSRTCENLPYESINSNERVSDRSCVGSRSSTYVGMEGRESGYIELDGECSGGRCVVNGMAKLESELEAELQLLELQLDSADISRDTNQDDVQESSDGGYETHEYDDEANYANDPIDKFAEAHDGSVSPRELERRLHEVLEAQQLERIKELEAALGRTKLKLRKKEMEVCWWKDTAHLISQHVSKTAPHNIPPLKDHTKENFT